VKPIVLGKLVVVLRGQHAGDPDHLRRQAVQAVDERHHTTYKWQNDTVNFECEADIKANFARILKSQLDPQDMIDRMVFVIGSDDGKYRNSVVGWCG
jgi:hypothetical protein